MERNIKIARELVRIAKMLVAFQHEPVTIGPFRIYVNRIAVGNMRYPGDFICVSAPYNDIIQIKDELKRIGFRYDRDYGWHCFWNKVNWADVEAICNAHQSQIDQNTAPCPVEENQEFDMNLTISEVGAEEARDFYVYRTNVSTTYKRKFNFTDAAGNVYKCTLSNKRRTWHCDPIFWSQDGKDWAPDIAQKVGQQAHVIGTPWKINKTANNYEIFFRMK